MPLSHSGTQKRLRAKVPAKLDVLEGGARAASEENPQQFSRTAWLIDVLRKRIVSGEYEPGERIPEARLRAEFGFSNGPIRKRCRRLLRMALPTGLHGKECGSRHSPRSRYSNYFRSAPHCWNTELSSRRGLGRLPRLRGLRNLGGK